MRGIKVCGTMADKLRTRGYGTNEGGCINLSYEEALYLSERDFGTFSFENLFKEAASKLQDFDIRFFVYRDLRQRGYVVSVEKDRYLARKSYRMHFYPMSENQKFDMDVANSKELPFALAIVDGDGDITYYMVNREEPRGSNYENFTLKEHIIAGSRVFLIDSPEELGTYGKRESKFAYLSNNEARYLTGDEKIKVDESVYEVYADLRNRHLVVKSGFKYGTHFRVYEKSLEEHSRYLVHVLSEPEDLQRLSRAVRVAHGVRKTLLLAKKKDRKVVYLSVRWIRP